MYRTFYSFNKLSAFSVVSPPFCISLVGVFMCALTNPVSLLSPVGLLVSTTTPYICGSVYLLLNYAEILSFFSQFYVTMAFSFWAPSSAPQEAKPPCSSQHHPSAHTHASTSTFQQPLHLFTCETRISNLVCFSLRSLCSYLNDFTGF